MPLLVILASICTRLVQVLAVVLAVRLPGSASEEAVRDSPRVLAAADVGDWMALLAPAFSRPSPGLCGQLQSEQADGGSFSFFLFFPILFIF